MQPSHHYLCNSITIVHMFCNVKQYFYIKSQLRKAIKISAMDSSIPVTVQTNKKKSKSSKKQDELHNRIIEEFMSDMSSLFTSKSPTRKRKRHKDNPTRENKNDTLIQTNIITNNETYKTVQTEIKPEQIPPEIPQNSPNDVRNDLKDEMDARNAYMKWKQQNGPGIKVSRRAALDALKLLEEPVKKRVTQDCFNRNCMYKLANTDLQNSAWDSASTITSAIRECILNKQWHLLPDFIKTFIQLGMSLPAYYNHARELAYLNFLVNADSDENELLEEFMQLFFVRIGIEKRITEFDVWYKE